MIDQAERDQLAAALDLLIALAAVEVRLEERDESDKQLTRELIPSRRRGTQYARNANGTFA